MGLERPLRNPQELFQARKQGQGLHFVTLQPKIGAAGIDDPQPAVAAFRQAVHFARVAIAKHQVHGAIAFLQGFGFAFCVLSIV